MDVRRFSVASVLDVTSLNDYYSRLDVYASFTDTGDFDETGFIDQNIRPHGVFGYPINDVVGRISRESTLYAKVFRYRHSREKILQVTNYTFEDFKKDYVKLRLKLKGKDIEALDIAYAEVPSMVGSDNGFARYYLMTYLFAQKTASGRASIALRWARVIRLTGYMAINDSRGTGVISKKNRACIVIVGDNSRIESLEIVSTQKHKKEQNIRIADRIVRYNASTKVSNARNRIKK